MYLRSIPALVALATLATAAVASAQPLTDDHAGETIDEPEVQHARPGERPGLQIGARAGFAVGSGSVYDGFHVSDGSNGVVPFTADVGVRLLPQLYLGAYGSYAYVIPKTNPTSCPETFDCSVKDLRLGLEADWHFLPRHSFDPYVGLFGGYEWLSNHVTGTKQIPLPTGPQAGNVDANVLDRGWELGIALGSDIRVARAFALGPYLSASLGRYVTRSGTTDVSVGGTEVSSSSAAAVDHAYHQIYVIGLRGTLNTL